MRLLSCCVFLILLVTGCATTEQRPATTQDPVEWKGSSAAPQGTLGNKSPYTVLGKSYEVLPDSLGYLEIGVASWYGRKFHGRLTSNGETYDMHGMTAAHKSLPIPTIVKVTNLDNGRKAIVRVNDRGPFHDDRLIDVSFAVASQLGFADKGIAPVVVEAVDELNYPDLNVTGEDHEFFYLQVGAFAHLSGAQRQLERVRNLISTNGVDQIGVKILRSELEDSILHKVWMGPITSEQQMDTLAGMVKDANLAIPHRVKLE